MRVTILTIGTTGSVLPYMALGHGLQSRGHAVRIATHREFEDQVRQRGLEFSQVAGDPKAIMAGKEGRRLVQRNPLLFGWDLLRIARPLIAEGLQDLWAASLGAEVLVYSLMVAPAARHIVARQRVTGVMASFFPALPSASLPPVVAPTFPLPGTRAEAYYNRLTPEIIWRAVEHIARFPLRGWRRDTLGMPPSSLLRPFADLPEPAATLMAYSPAVLPRPVDWPDSATVTGYWWTDFDPGWTPPPDLVDFLNTEPRPIAIGFGSMVGGDSRAVLAIVREALRRSGQRAVVLTGWGGIARADVPDAVYLADAVPHDWLFPRVSAVVHHAGAGTTGAGLRAGAPTVSVPLFEDQFFWGRRVHALGVGPRPIRFRDLTAAALAEAIDQAVHDDAMRARADRLARAIRREDGVAVAVDAIERAAGVAGSGAGAPTASTKAGGRGGD